MGQHSLNQKIRADIAALVIIQINIFADLNAYVTSGINVEELMEEIGDT